MTDLCRSCSRTLVPQARWRSMPKEERRALRNTHARYGGQRLCGACHLAARKAGSLELVQHQRTPEEVEAAIAALTPPNPSGLCLCGCGQTTPISAAHHIDDGVLAGHHTRYVSGTHAARHKAEMVGHTARFWAKVDKRGPGGCWLWTAALEKSGYGKSAPHPDVGSTLKAHRIAYTLLRGPVSDSLALDHLCRVRSCVNPEHLEPVDNAENTRRAAAVRTHCLRGHEYTQENTYRRQDGTRQCRVCAREVTAIARARESA